VGIESCDELVGVSLLCDAKVEDGPGRGFPSVQTGGSLIDRGLVKGNVVVQAGDLGCHVRVPASLGIRFSYRPLRCRLPGCVAVPPAVSVLDGPLGALPFSAGFGQVPDRPRGLGAGSDATAVRQIGSSLPCPLKGLFGLAQGGGPVRQSDADDRLAGDRLLGV
jgi:hypothetical protein